MAESENFDVLIVGAGPAGSFAGERLARAGTMIGGCGAIPTKTIKPAIFTAYCK